MANGVTRIIHMRDEDYRNWLAEMLTQVMERTMELGGVKKVGETGLALTVVSI